MNAMLAAAPAHIRELPADLPHVLEMCEAPRMHEDRNACIAAAAFFIAERRGFTPGHELDDWLEAEREVDARLCSEGCAY
jgi:hypothetical protein